MQSPWAVQKSILSDKQRTPQIIALSYYIWEALTSYRHVAESLAADVIAMSLVFVDDEHYYLC